MSKQCEDIRPLLAELVYGEVDPDAAEMVKEHLGSCLPCRRYQKAFVAVREDLLEWTPAEADGSRGITFIAPAAHARPSIFTHPAVRGLAVAASFVLGVFLMAAAVNLQIHSDASGWSVSTSLWNPRAVVTDPAAVASQPQQEAAPAEATQANRPTAVPPALTDPRGASVQRVGFEQIEPELENWLDSQLVTRGVVHRTALPSLEQLTESQQQQVLAMVADRLARQDSVHEQYFRDLLAASEARQMEQFAATLTSLYGSLEAERNNALSLLLSELGLWHVESDRRLQQANVRIDLLLSQVSSRRERDPER